MKESVRSIKGARRRSGNIGPGKKNSRTRSTVSQRLLSFQTLRLPVRMLRHSSNNMKKGARSAKGALEGSGNIGQNPSSRSTANQRLLWLQCSKLASRKPMTSTLSLGSLVYIYYGFLATDSPVDTDNHDQFRSDRCVGDSLPELSILHLRTRRHSSSVTTTRLQHPPYHAHSPLRILQQTQESTISDLSHDIRSSMTKVSVKVKESLSSCSVPAHLHCHTHTYHISFIFIFEAARTISEKFWNVKSGQRSTSL